MPNSNKTTRPVMFRIPTEVYEIIERRIQKHPRHHKVSEYLRERTTYDILRSHKKKEEGYE